MSASAPRTSITSWPARTPGRSRHPMLVGLATWVIVGHSERRRDAGETDDASAASSVGPWTPACGRSCAWASSSRNARPAARAEVVDAQLAAPWPATTPPRRRAAAWSSPTSRSGRSARAGTRPAPTRPRWPPIRSGEPRRPRLARGRAPMSRPVRRQRHVGEYRRVHRRAVDRRGARRRRVAQARRDGGHRRAGRDHGPRPPAALG